MRATFMQVYSFIRISMRENQAFTRDPYVAQSPKNGSLISQQFGPSKKIVPDICFLPRISTYLIFGFYLCFKLVPFMQLSNI